MVILKKGKEQDGDLYLHLTITTSQPMLTNEKTNTPSYHLQYNINCIIIVQTQVYFFVFFCVTNNGYAANGHLQS